MKKLQKSRLRSENIRATIVSCRFAQRNNLIMPVEMYDYTHLAEREPKTIFNICFSSIITV